MFMGRIWVCFCLHTPAGNDSADAGMNEYIVILFISREKTEFMTKRFLQSAGKSAVRLPIGDCQLTIEALQQGSTPGCSRPRLSKKINYEDEDDNEDFDEATIYLERLFESVTWRDYMPMI
jgi:hypothetical protein